MNKLENLLEQKKDLNKQSSNIFEKQLKLDNEILQERMKEVFATGALTETDWKVQIDVIDLSRFKKCKFCLYSSQKFKKLRELLETDYHCGSQLADKVSIRFDDGDIRIEFEDKDTAFNFINEHRLRFDLTDLVDELNKFKTKYEIHDNFLKEFKTKITFMTI